MDRLTAHIDRSWDLISRGDTAAAMIAARKALEIDRRNPEVHNLIGYIHALGGEFDEAIESYRAAIDLDEWYLDPILNAAELLSHEDADPEEAIRLCRRATDMELAPEEAADAAFIEIEALFNSGREAEVRQRLDSIDGVEGLAPSYRAIVGRTYYDIGDLERAQEHVDAALALDPDLPDALYCAGLIAREEGRRVDAVDAFLKLRGHDLGLPRLPWGAAGPEEARASVEEAIGRLPEGQRALLEGTEIRLAPYPDEGQISDLEIDPRGIALAEGIDPRPGAYRRLWIFLLNLERLAPPSAAVEELAHAISAELGEPCRKA